MSNTKLIPCPDGTMADPTIGCVTAPSAVVDSETNLVEIILQISTTLMSIVIVVSALLLIYSGIIYAMAAGNDEKIQKSKRIMFWSLTGLVVAILAKVGVQSILNIVTS